MKKWFFPTRGYGETEGFANPALELFKGEPIRAMAREIVQNSLDAVREKNKPVRIEFENLFVKSCVKFPGISDMQNIFEKCKSFWKDQNDEKTMEFIREGARAIRDGGISVLRVSDYNTTGLTGAFSADKLTPWKSLVQGNAFSIKASSSAAGSYGIGKAAPFVVSKIQTVFYRTYDKNETRAAQGVTHLVSFEDKEMSKPGEDYIRRSTGYYGNGEENKPFEYIKELDEINTRKEYGTDLFIPAFNSSMGKNNWQDEIIIEILDNFLISIYSKKLEVKIDKTVLKKDTLLNHINRLPSKTKNAECFYNVIRTDNEDVIEAIKKVKGGYLKLRLLYKPDANKQILVVRNSGMKIAKIPGLPKGISYTGTLEILGDTLNKIFRGMENPQHNAWEPKRHNNPELAKEYKKMVEDWVKEMITKKITENSGNEIDIDLREYFNGKELDSHIKNSEDEEKKHENIIDNVKDINIIQEDIKTNKIKVKDIGGDSSNGSKKIKGVIDDASGQIGHRHRSGKRKNASSTGRRGFSSIDGQDTIYEGLHEVNVSARIISKGNSINRLIFTAEDDITTGELEIMTMGENGSPLILKVKSVNGLTFLAEAKDGHIRIHNIKANQKNIMEFSIVGTKSYAMGVRAYEN